MTKSVRMYSMKVYGVMLHDVGVGLWCEGV